MLVLQNMSVHEERFTRSRRTLESEGVQVFYRIVRQVRGRTMAGLFMVQVGAQGLGIVEIAMQIMLGEQQGEVLVGFPGPSVFLCHTKPAAVLHDVGIVIGKLVSGNAGECRAGVERLGIVALTSRDENALGIAQPFEHPVHVVVAKLKADEAMQGEATL